MPVVDVSVAFWYCVWSIFIVLANLSWVFRIAASLFRLMNTSRHMDHHNQGTSNVKSIYISSMNNWIHCTTVVLYNARYHASLLWWQRIDQQLALFRFENLSRNLGVPFQIIVLGITTLVWKFQSFSSLPSPTRAWKAGLKFRERRCQFAT